MVGRKPIGPVAMTNAERQRRHKQKQQAELISLRNEITPKPKRHVVEIKPQEDGSTFIIMCDECIAFNGKEAPLANEIPAAEVAKPVPDPPTMVKPRDWAIRASIAAYAERHLPVTTRKQVLAIRAELKKLTEQGGKKEYTINLSVVSEATERLGALLLDLDILDPEIQEHLDQLAIAAKANKATASPGTVAYHTTLIEKTIILKARHHA